ncbi:hypothetical protein GCM10011369_25900 [Neiella marina]|uniref:Polysaccharide lyase n=1 Tax=Neiella marina TaxID=508461 RepID=A0A8J2XQ13_9GAMM|nr:hypothetical protein [Neiella marina]GGA82737.1 hypothetical protein GCM10011369_25900 [Neiella marina]
MSNIRTLVIVASLSLIGCATDNEQQQLPLAQGIKQSDGRQLVSESVVKADGVDVGYDSYQLIEDAYGKRSIEAPDLFVGDHTGVRHIVEVVDDVVGPHFAFLIHRDLDGNKGQYIDRQRNEIKVFGGSEDYLKGYQHKLFEYRWKFKVNHDFSLTKRFSHFFQLKAVGGADKMPIITLTGNIRNGQKGMELRHSSGSEHSLLARVPWQRVTDEWLQITCFAKYQQQGILQFVIQRLSDGEVLMAVDAEQIDLWRGLRPEHFVRPKWGIYRSVVQKDLISAKQERVLFADFEIREWQ